jgi:hypothetical protein
MTVYRIPLPVFDYEFNNREVASILFDENTNTFTAQSGLSECIPNFIETGIPDFRTAFDMLECIWQDEMPGWNWVENFVTKESIDYWNSEVNHENVSEDYK